MISVAIKCKYILSTAFLLLLMYTLQAQTPLMLFGDTTATGVPFSKDPYVLKFNGKYLMYYSKKDPHNTNTNTGWSIGIAQSSNLIDWEKIGEIRPARAYEKKGICAPSAIIKDGKVHLFYQSYGNEAKDAICHAISADGIHFERDASNPVFHPNGDWTNGRAIDAEVCLYDHTYYLYFATRDPGGKIQKLGVATAPEATDFSRACWKQASDCSILQPEFKWEGNCIEAPSVIVQDDTFYMFYAGNYNNAPQQIGLAVSKDGLHWKRVTNNPFLANGKPGSWNTSESGHPDIFRDSDGATYLFYQGNNDNGKSWYISKLKIDWQKGTPYVNHTANAIQFTKQ
ncbi:MAG: family 43 glycosylhydrolase [Niabella sp.]|nr:family 43 glycosylhydrolase [Niabella sp.]